MENIFNNQFIWHNLQLKIKWRSVYFEIHLDNILNAFHTFCLSFLSDIFVFFLLCTLLPRSNLILKNQRRAPSIDDAINYFDLMANYLDEMRTIHNELRYQIK